MLPIAPQILTAAPRTSPANFPLYANLRPPGYAHFLPVVSHFGFLGQHHALYWNLATIGAVKYAPQGQIAGSVLELMLGPRSHEQEVA
jgi:hypothetical protein